MKRYLMTGVSAVVLTASLVVPAFARPVDINNTSSKDAWLTAYSRPWGAHDYIEGSWCVPAGAHRTRDVAKFYKVIAEIKAGTGCGGHNIGPKLARDMKGNSFHATIKENGGSFSW